MPEILVVDRSSAISLSQVGLRGKRWAVISIRNPDMEQIHFKVEGDLQGAMHLAFDDINELQPKMIAFTVDMGRAIWDFVEQVWPKIDVLVVHCNHGMSRSPAVAAAIAKVKLGNDSWYFEHQMPNSRVYKATLKAIGKYGAI